jgi:hypothetical protein
MTQWTLQAINEKQMPDGYQWISYAQATRLGMGRVARPDGSHILNKSGVPKTYRHWDNAVDDAWKDKRKKR